ncbi:MAG TPA: CBS domain-containing protein [Pararhizobium sp.]|nr:CBS domain-containing protein [Paracoccaceae bacterium]HET7411145.1 CBS domain-containing protein [Pararhizobium sp.]
MVAETLWEAPLPLVTIGEDAPLLEAARRLRGPDAKRVVVCAGDGRMRGVVGKTDIVDRISHCAGRAADRGTIAAGSARRRH